ncbi:uncharacterized protein LOC129727977 [Wyeomyia smithii]|uniref:uncharacterized protein LOC129727977 n=1 Tax=Wyeomyia smithii TaxID=174621 RepID=UPI0024680B38|nr:uncharacterized protein LOC129727977 [Wyeomyia smithii]
MAIPLDAREILSHLNQLGYRNITPEQLKEFQKDLRKLIKYDNQIGSNFPADHGTWQQTVPQMNPFQRLHTSTTISYDAKIASKRLKQKRQHETNPRRQSATTASSSHRTEFESTAANPQGQLPRDDKENHQQQQHQQGRKGRKQQEEKNTAASKMWIRPRSTSASRNRKNDPVSLYHAYQKEWARFRNQLPGENSHSDLRWQVRTKLLAEK